MATVRGYKPSVRDNQAIGLAMKRAKRRDRWARWLITIGGMAIIATVFGMLLLILRVALPLFFPPDSTLLLDTPVAVEAGTPVLASGADEYLETAYVVTGAGEVIFYDLPEGDEAARETISPPEDGPGVARVESWTQPRENQSPLYHEHALHWTDGSITLASVRFEPVYGEGDRYIAHEIITGEHLPAAPEAALSTVRTIRDGGIVRVDVLRDTAALRLTKQVISRDIFDEVTTETVETNVPLAGAGTVTALAVDSYGENLYAGTDSGTLLRWDIEDPDVIKHLDSVYAADAAITALTPVFGDASIAVGAADGSLETWFPIPNPEGDGKVLAPIHPLAPHNAAVLRIEPSQRNKSLASYDADGGIHVSHMTSEKRLLALDAPQLTSMAFSPRSDGVVATTTDNRLLLWAVDNDHPETTWKTLFGEVWYEGYPEPDYTWQSTGPTDDFEPKLSLVPLVFGSFKGTVYAMILAVPLALFGAIYTSQFTTPWFRQTIKPVVEVMAAIPSVVIGFLIALWLAPVLERFIVAFFLSLILIPFIFAIFMALWYPISNSYFARRVGRGFEFIFMFPVLLAAIYLARLVAAPVEEWMFEGNFQQWLFSTMDERYDQRNAIIIAFGLGFAVIPIIFTISEDALSNVPHNLRAASLALGASRWQTVWRVIVPSASPGIFAGIIIGFGRAVGETMIVLMATGNTPIIDWSPFNGMRTLSANIAVEIPEAPVDGTLYRVLFLSAVLLFLLTSVLNTVAEIFRHRLRRKYGQFT